MNDQAPLDEQINSRNKEMKKKTVESGLPLYGSARLQETLAKIETAGQIIRPAKKRVPEKHYFYFEVLEQIDRFQNGSGYSVITKGDDEIRVRDEVLRATAETSSELIEDNSRHIYKKVKDHKFEPEQPSKPQKQERGSVFKVFQRREPKQESVEALIESVYVRFDENGKIIIDKLTEHPSYVQEEMPIPDMSRVARLNLVKVEGVPRVSEVVFMSEKPSAEYRSRQPDLTMAQVLIQASVNKANQISRGQAGATFNSQPVIKVQSSEGEIFSVKF